MQRVSTRTFALAAGLAVTAFAAVQFSPGASGQTGEGWVTLLDSKTMGDWNQVGESNWRLEDGAVVADKKTSKDPAHLVSKTVLQGLPGLRRILGQRRRQQRHLPALPGPHEDHRPELL